MRMSKHFGLTLREAPAESGDIISHQLLLRAGYIRPLAAGVYSYLPLAYRTMKKIENIIREEINAIGGQEITMPVVHPGELWKETNRWYEIDASLTRFQDRAGRDMALGMTHEEVIADLVRKDIRSYRQLPQLLYQIQTKWRDEARPRAGLIRVREFTMKDSYSLDADETGLDQQYRAHYQAYFNIYHLVGLPVIAVASDVGMMGGKLAHEFMYLTPIGEDTLLLCDACGYAANREVARFQKPLVPQEEQLPMEKIATPNATTIEALTDFLNIPKSKTAKAVFMMATMVEDDGERQQFVFAVVRGDMEVNEAKLSHAIKAKALRAATDEEIRARGAVAGYGSPVGVRDCLIVVDDAVGMSTNLVAGANQAGYHLLNVNLGRDYKADVVADIVSATDGDACPTCGQPLRAVRGVEVGNIFKLGTRYTEKLGATFLDKEGHARPVMMGSYGIGVGRLMACIVEEHHDDAGIIWPITVAPYHLHLVALSGDDVATAADTLYEELTQNGIEVLYDDRDERAGVKFNDADLIGLPLRLTVSKRSLEKQSAEYKRRAAGESDLIPLHEVVGVIQTEIAAMRADIQKTVVTVPFKI